MRKTFKLLPYILGMALITMIVSCGKEGPAGPAGPAGPPGAVGASGPAGPAGATGTANVIYSNWIDTTTWKADTVMNGSVIDTVGFFATINAPKLDANILDKGEIKVYVKVNTFNNASVVSPLPYNDGLIFIDPLFYLNNILLSANAKLTGVPFRYILIPGGTTARTAGTVNWNDYKQVQAYLGLKD